MSRRILSNEEVLELRQKHLLGMSIAQCMIEMNLVMRMSPMAVYNAAKGHTYKKVQLSPKQVQQVNRQFEQQLPAHQRDYRPGMQRQDMQMFQNIGGRLSTPNLNPSPNNIKLTQNKP